VRDVSEALRPSWKLAAGRLPCVWGRRWAERASDVPGGSRPPRSVSEARNVDMPPTADCIEGFWLDEDFRQLSEEAPSEGLTTMPTPAAKGRSSKSVTGDGMVCCHWCISVSVKGHRNKSARVCNAILTGGVALMEAGRHLCQRVSAGGGGGEDEGPGDLAGLLLLQVPGTHFLADAGLQQAVGGYGTVPQQPVQAGLHREHHALRTGGGSANC